MSEPLVCAIMPTIRGREAMRYRAFRSFKAQVYANRKLWLHESFKASAVSVGGQRNEAISEGIATFALFNKSAAGVEIIAHFDDDDWSHPNRLAEQVALLQSSRADAVGYSDLLFWRTPENEAWLWRASSPRPVPPGTSLCYWRKTWERKPFLDHPQPHDKSVNWGEDYAFCRGLNVAVASSIVDGQPRMIASIHAGNTSPAYQRLEAPEWTRVPEWDDYCRERMTL